MAVIGGDAGESEVDHSDGQADGPANRRCQCISSGGARGESEVDHSAEAHPLQQQRQDSTAIRGRWRGSSRRKCIE